MVNSRDAKDAAELAEQRRREEEDLNVFLKSIHDDYRYRTRRARFLRLSAWAVPIASAMASILTQHPLPLVGLAYMPFAYWRARDFERNLLASWKDLSASDENTIAYKKDLRQIERDGRSIALADIGCSPVGQYVFSTSQPVPVCPNVYCASTEMNDTIVLADKIPFAIGSDRTATFMIDREQPNGAWREQIKYLIARVIDSPQLTVNEEKFGLTWSASSPIAASVYKATYFDALITNEAFCDAVHLRDQHLDEGDELFKLDHYFPASPVVQGTEMRYRLDPLEDSRCANGVGITVLGITKDHVPVIFRQSRRMAVGEGMITCAGSGSADFGDLTGMDHGSDLLSVLKFSMAREFVEEARQRGFWRASPRGDRLFPIYKNTIVTGYFRWMDRCGKPEFVGASRIDATFNEIYADKYEVTQLGTKPVEVKKMSDFALLRTQLEELALKRHTTIGLSSYVCLIRLSEIASYETSNEPRLKQVFERTRSILGL